MKITWDDISVHLVYCKLTSTEPNRVYKEIYDSLKYWIPSIIPDTKVTINNKYSYHYDPETKDLWIDYKNIWSVFKSKYGMRYHDVQALITGYVVNTHIIEVKHTHPVFYRINWIVVNTHSIEVDDLN
jgi:hypothetical protein